MIRNKKKKKKRGGGEKKKKKKKKKKEGGGEKTKKTRENKTINAETHLTHKCLGWTRDPSITKKIRHFGGSVESQMFGENIELNFILQWGQDLRGGIRLLRHIRPYHVVYK